MTVKALCNVIYGGKLYGAGETFESETLLPNTEKIIINEQKKPPENEPSEPEEDEKHKKRR